MKGAPLSGGGAGGRRRGGAVGVCGSKEGAVAEAEEQPLRLPAERVALEHVDYAEKVDALAVRRRNAALLEQRRQPAAAAIDAVDADEQRIVERACSQPAAVKRRRSCRAVGSSWWGAGPSAPCSARKAASAATISASAALSPSETSTDIEMSSHSQSRSVPAHGPAV